MNLATHVFPTYSTVVLSRELIKMKGRTSHEGGGHSSTTHKVVEGE